ncbi:MAG: helix-hairpin-helix domain-containing protein [Desulfuromonadaceae bacterium]|nr:helix-hairpin-helix domain-containing protein [Desulfuromonadaceae bacterium]
MKIFTKASLVAVSLLLSTGIGFAATTAAPAPTAAPAATAPALDLKGAAKSVGAGVKADAKAAAKAKLVDINTATAAELKTIPGIGEALAAKVIAGRPYANKTQLKSRNVIPANVYEQVKDLIIAKALKK